MRYIDIQDKPAPGLLPGSPRYPDRQHSRRSTTRSPSRTAGSRPWSRPAGGGAVRLAGRFACRRARPRPDRLAVRACRGGRDGGALVLVFPTVGTALTCTGPRPRSATCSRRTSSAPCARGEGGLRPLLPCGAVRRRRTVERRRKGLRRTLPLPGRSPGVGRLSISGTYVDSHVWLFSPGSFVEQLHQLRLIGRSPWYVDTVRSTQPNENEFMVRLRRLARGRAGYAFAGEVLPDSPRPDWLDEQIRVRITLEREAWCCEDRLTVQRAPLQAPGAGRTAARR